jgi:phosphohistidine phosphatase
MQVLLIRHAAAEDAEEFARAGGDDALRPLTKMGRWKMERIARGLHTVVPAIDVLASSTLVRARQTAEIVAEAYRDLSPEAIPSLAPASRPGAFVQWLRRQEAATVAAVGHEPHLPALAGLLVTGHAQPWLSFKKGGACLLDFEGEVAPGEARLVWMLTPALLRRLGA